MMIKHCRYIIRVRFTYFNSCSVLVMPNLTCSPISFISAMVRILGRSVVCLLYHRFELSSSNAHYHGRYWGDWLNSSYKERYDWKAYNKFCAQSDKQEESESNCCTRMILLLTNNDCKFYLSQVFLHNLVNLNASS